MRLASATELPTPTYDRNQLEPNIVHIGVGGFHRAHLALYCHELAERGSTWGIHGVGLLSFDQQMAEVMASQDCLYTLTERADDERSTQVIGSIIDYTWCPPSDDPGTGEGGGLPVGASDEATLIDVFAAPTTRIISMTVTEGGYADEPRNQRTFDLIAAGLDARRERNLGGVTVMSCDNVVANGDVARGCVAAAARRRSDDLAAWVEQTCSFPNSMVDRITPSTTDADRAAVLERFGIVDGWPVVCEPFRQWVLEDNFAAGRPDFDQVGVLYSTDVHAWELYKLRMLNAGHSTLAYLSALANIVYVDEALATPQVATYLERFLYDEAAPSLNEIPGFPREDYAAALTERFANKGVRDQIARLCMDGTAKFPTFLMPTIRDQLASGGDVTYSALALAGWAHYLSDVPVDQQAPDADAETSRTYAVAALDDAVRFLDHHAVFPEEIATNDTFREAFETTYRLISEHGALGAIDHLASSA